MEMSTPTKPTPVAAGLDSSNNDASSSVPSAADAVPDKPARVGFHHAPLPFRGPKEPMAEPQQERVEGEWARSFAERRSYTGWSIAAASTYTECTEPDLDSPRSAAEEPFVSDLDPQLSSLSLSKSIPLRQQNFGPPSRAPSFPSADRYGSSPDSRPAVPWQRRPSDMASPSPRRSRPDRLSNLSTSQLGPGPAARDFSRPSPIAEDARSAFDSEEEEVVDQDEGKGADNDDDGTGDHEDKGKGVEEVSSDPAPLLFVRGKGSDEFHSSVGAYTPDSVSETGASPGRRSGPDDGLVQDVSDRLLKHIYGIELGDLADDRASAAYESISDCLDNISRIIDAGSPATNQMAREPGFNSNNISIQPAGGAGGGGFGFGGMGGGSPGGDNRKGRPKKRPGDGHDKDDDEDEDGDGDDGYKQPGGKRQKVESFSCPFRKRNPIRFNVRDYLSCATQSFPDMPQLKRHIKHSHRKESLALITCPRCKQTFESHEALDRHSTLPAHQMCAVQDERHSADPEDGITTQIEDALNGRKANTKVDRWDALWNVLFPNDLEVLSSEFVPPTELDEVQQEFSMSTGTLRSALSTDFEELRQQVMHQNKDQAIDSLLQMFERHTEEVIANRRAKTVSSGRPRKQRNQGLKPGPQHSRRPSGSRSIHRIQSTETMASPNDHSGIPSSIGTPESGTQYQRQPPLQTNCTPSPGGYQGYVNPSPGGYQGGCMSASALSPESMTPIIPHGMGGQFPVTVMPPHQTHGVLPVANHLVSPVQPSHSNHRRVSTSDSAVSVGQGPFMMSPNVSGVPPSANFGNLPVRQQPGFPHGLGISHPAGPAATSPINEMTLFGRPQQQLQQLQQQQQQATLQRDYDMQFAHQQMEFPDITEQDIMRYMEEETPMNAGFGPQYQYQQQQQGLEVRVQPPSNQNSSVGTEFSPRP